MQNARRARCLAEQRGRAGRAQSLALILLLPTSRHRLGSRGTAPTEGRAARRVAAGSRLSWTETLGVLRDAAAGLVYAESKRIVVDSLIPPRVSAQQVHEFSEALGISPGLVVGRLQHEGRLPRTHLNALKRGLTWS